MAYMSDMYDSPDGKEIIPLKGFTCRDKEDIRRGFFAAVDRWENRGGEAIATTSRNVASTPRSVEAAGISECIHMNL